MLMESHHLDRSHWDNGMSWKRHIFITEIKLQWNMGIFTYANCKLIPIPTQLPSHSFNLFGKWLYFVSEINIFVSIEFMSISQRLKRSSKNQLKKKHNKKSLYLYSTQNFFSQCVEQKSNMHVHIMFTYHREKVIYNLYI